MSPEISDGNPEEPTLDEQLRARAGNNEELYELLVTEVAALEDINAQGGFDNASAEAIEAYDDLRSQIQEIEGQTEEPLDAYSHVPSPSEEAEKEFQRLRAYQAIQSLSAEVAELINEGNPWQEDRELHFEQMAAASYGDERLAKLVIELEKLKFWKTQLELSQENVDAQIELVENSIQRRKRVLKIED